MNKLRNFNLKLRDGEQVKIYAIGEENYKRVIFIPTLIGGSYMQQYKNFAESLVGNLFVTFAYRGHRSSTGKFSIEQCLEDTVEVVNYLKEKYADKEFCAIGTCFGSMPIMHLLRKNQNVFSKVAFVNAIFNIQNLATPLEALKVSLSHTKPYNLLRPKSLIHGITNHYFPQISQSRDHFGLLKYENASLLKLVREYLSPPSMDNIEPINCSLLCCIGTDDKLLKLHIPEERNNYVEKFKKLFNSIEFYSNKAYHFWTAKEHLVNMKIKDYFDQPSQTQYGMA